MTRSQFTHLKGDKSMTGSLKLLLVSAGAGLLMLATAVPAFAAPPDGAANGGLGMALTQVVAHTPGKGANPPMDTLLLPGAPGLGTHTAVGRILGHNPAVDPCLPPFDLPCG